MELHPYLHKVQFYETDGMSIVHHGNHILWMEEAHSDFLDQLGYRMVDSVTGQLRAEGTSVHFFYDRAKGRPVSLKKALPEVYTLLEAFMET